MLLFAPLRWRIDKKVASKILSSELKLMTVWLIELFSLDCRLKIASLRLKRLTNSYKKCE